MLVQYLAGTDKYFHIVNRDLDLAF